MRRYLIPTLLIFCMTYSTINSGETKSGDVFLGTLGIRGKIDQLDQIIMNAYTGLKNP